MPVTMTHTPAEAFAPGEYLRDEIDERGWTVTEFAEIIGRPLQAVSEILNGKKEITTETAVALGEALGTSPALWLNLQTNYRIFEQRTRKSSTNELTPVARRARLRGLIPLAEARIRGWLPKTDDLDSNRSCREASLNAGGARLNALAIGASRGVRSESATAGPATYAAIPSSTPLVQRTTRRERPWIT